MEKSKIGIIGSKGLLGGEFRRRCLMHPVFKESFSIEPEGLSSMGEKDWQKHIKEILESNELAVLAVHDEIAKKIVAVKKEIESTIKIIDCSTAHRTDLEWTYGLPELPGQKAQIQDSELVANPGCHATAAILSVKPLMEEGMIDPEGGIITSITGYSGGGNEMMRTTYITPHLIAPTQYSTGMSHKHIPEIMAQTGLKDPLFQPEVVNTFQGLKTNSFLNLTEEGLALSQSDLINIFEAYYQDENFVTVSSVPEQGKILMDENIRAQNTSIYVQKHQTKVQVIAVIDNLWKGSAGAALQNANLMLGLEEDMGLVF